jgi:hypothetical protein
LIVDPYRVLASAVSFQGLKPVARWRPEVVQVHRGVEIAQLAAAVFSRSEGNPFGLSPLNTACVTASLKLLITPAYVSTNDTIGKGFVSIYDTVLMCPDHGFTCN